MWFRKDPDNMTFKQYLRLLRRSKDEEDAQLFTELQSLPVRLALLEQQTNNRVLTLDEVERMKWKDVKFRINIISESQKARLQVLSEVLEQLQSSKSKGSDAGWDGSIRVI